MRPYARACAATTPDSRTGDRTRAARGQHLLRSDIVERCRNMDSRSTIVERCRNMDSRSTILSRRLYARRVQPSICVAGGCCDPSDWIWERRSGFALRGRPAKLFAVRQDGIVAGSTSPHSWCRVDHGEWPGPGSLTVGGERELRFRQRLEGFGQRRGIARIERPEA